MRWCHETLLRVLTPVCSAVYLPGRAAGAEDQGARASGAHDPCQPLNSWRRAFGLLLKRP